ncbi:MAG: hypothetical protein ACN4GW_05485 [Desulforhopalus sp.]
MSRYFRQLVFVVYALILQWPVLCLIWVFGRLAMFKVLFLIYPTDRSECLDFCPDIPLLRRFFSGNPTPAGLIMDGWLPIGIYLVVPNTAMELARKKNRAMVETIIERMRWYQKISGAHAIGLAGQLGPIFEKQSGGPMVPPFYSSTYGNIFSIHKAVSHLATSSNRTPWQISVATVGGGDLADQLNTSLVGDGYRVVTVDVRYTRKGGVRLVDEGMADRQLRGVDVVINLLPRGKDFLDCNIHNRISESAAIVDFSRPPIPKGAVGQTVVKGNRVQSGGLHFFVNLPGGWKRHELPACSMPSLLASLGNLPFGNMDEFQLAARHLSFSTALSNGAIQTAPQNSLVRGVEPRTVGNRV